MSTTADFAALDAITLVIALARPQANQTILKIAEAIIDADPDAVTAATAGAREGLAQLRATSDLLSNRPNQPNFNGDLFAQVLEADCVDATFVTKISRMIGALGTAIDLVESDPEQARQSFSGLSKDVLATIVSINSALKQIAEFAVEWQKSSESETSMMNSVDGALADMAKLSNSISMLAINASIEANRAGERGGAFGVLAQEMHRQATQSRQTLEKAQQAMGRANSGAI